MRANRIYGFLFGVVVAGGTSYFYVYEEYKAANDQLAEDVDVGFHAGWVKECMH